MVTDFSRALVIRRNEIFTHVIDQRIRQLQTAAFSVTDQTFIEPWMKNDALCG